MVRVTKAPRWLFRNPSSPPGQEGSSWPLGTLLDHGRIDGLSRQRDEVGPLLQRKRHTCYLGTSRPRPAHKPFCTGEVCPASLSLTFPNGKSQVLQPWDEGEALLYKLKEFWSDAVGVALPPLPVAQAGGQDAASARVVQTSLERRPRSPEKQVAERAEIHVIQPPAVGADRRTAPESRGRHDSLSGRPGRPPSPRQGVQEILRAQSKIPEVQEVLRVWLVHIPTSLQRLGEARRAKAAPVRLEGRQRPGGFSQTAPERLSIEDLYGHQGTRWEVVRVGGLRGGRAAAEHRNEVRSDASRSRPRP